MKNVCVLFSFLFVVALQAQKNNLPVNKTPKQLVLEQISEENVRKNIQILKSFLKKENARTLIAPSKIELFFKKNNLMPVYNDSFSQHFSFVKYRPTSDQKLSLTFFKNNTLYQKLNFKYKTDFDFIPSSVNKTLYTQLVFVGYGLQYGMLAYNDFKGVDVRDKIIMRIKGFPGHKDTLSTAYKAFRWTDVKDTQKLEKSKNLVAKQLGVWGIIDVDTQKNDALYWDINQLFTWKKNTLYDGSLELDDKPLQIKISKRLFKKIIQENTIKIREFEKQVANNLSKFYSKTLEKTHIEISTSVLSKRVKFKNIVGMIRGKDTSRSIVIQANYHNVTQKNIIKNMMGHTSMFLLISILKGAKIIPEKNIIFLSSFAHGNELRTKYLSFEYKNKIDKWVHFDSYIKKQGNTVKHTKDLAEKVFLEVWNSAYETEK